MARNSQGIVDSFDVESVLAQHGNDGPKFTFIVPTDVAGSNESVSILTLKNQIREAKNYLIGSGMREADADSFLTPVTELLKDSSYWRLQSRSLAVFLAEGFFLTVRMPIELGDSLTIGETFHLLPFVPVLASDRKLYVLALAKNSVRLFTTTRNVIEELPLENIPASFDDVIDELPERVVDVRSGSAGTHGTPSFQGPDGDADLALLEKYIHAVGQAVGVRLGTARSQQLVLASVAEYLPLFTAACPYPAIFDGVIAGNPERALPDDLRSAAWQLVNNHEANREAQEHENAVSLAHAGRGSFDVAEIARAAAEGRIDTLFVPRDTAAITDESTRHRLNQAIIDTIATGGILRTLGVTDRDALAIFRY
ncbi:hypothetical protein [Microbacterium sp. YY-01]|uniref:baeRF3 domain-containing protein n=1 Tax=Microbacterium sp. YY-01 TaxID=3421634 RepID=UPI003D170FA6